MYKCFAEFHNARSLFSRYSTEANRHLCVSVRNNYNKVKTQAKFNYKRRKGLELCNITKRNPKNYVRQVLFHLKLLRYVRDSFLQSWFSGSEECHKLSIYKECKLEFCVEKQLDFHIIVQLLPKFRSDTLRLNVETGKYQNVARENRIC